MLPYLSQSHGNSHLTKCVENNDQLRSEGIYNLKMLLEFEVNWEITLLYRVNCEYSNLN